MKFLLPVILVGIFEEKIEAKKIERNSGWASTSVLDIVEVQSKYFIKIPMEFPYLNSYGINDLRATNFLVAFFFKFSKLRICIFCLILEQRNSKDIYF